MIYLSIKVYSILTEVVNTMSCDDNCINNNICVVGSKEGDEPITEEETMIGGEINNINKYIISTNKGIDKTVKQEIIDEMNGGNEALLIYKDYSKEMPCFSGRNHKFFDKIKLITTFCLGKHKGKIYGNCGLSAYTLACKLLSTGKIDKVTIMNVRYNSKGKEDTHVFIRVGNTYYDPWYESSKIIRNLESVDPSVKYNMKGEIEEKMVITKEEYESIIENIYLYLEETKNIKIEETLKKITGGFISENTISDMNNINVEMRKLYDT